MSIQRRVSVALAIQDAMGDMGLYDDRLRPVMTRWAEEAESLIGSFYQFKRAYRKASMCNENTMDIPCDVMAISGIFATSAIDETQCGKIFRDAYSYYQGYNTLAYTAGNFIINPLGVSVWFSRPQWEIRGNQIIFMTPQPIKDFVLDCFVREVDGDGFWLISETHREAVSQFIKWKLAERSRFDARMKTFTETQIAILQREWNRKCSNARAKDSAPTSSEMAEIRSMWNDPLTGSASSVWRYPDEFVRLNNFY